MVDALRRVRQMVATTGSVVDVHPTEMPATVAVGPDMLEPLDVGDAPERHAAAGAAVADVVAAGLFEVTAVADFLFFTYGDSADELREHIACTWRTMRMGERTAGRARQALAAAPAGTRVRVVEHVRLTCLRPTTDRDPRRRS
jgi:hypothetical protein